MAKLVTIYWRDIPAQVNAQEGRDRHRVVLTPRFLRSIQRAAKFANKTDVHEFVREWRRETTPCSADLVGEATRVAAEIEARFDTEALRAFIRTGGVDPATGAPDLVGPNAVPDDIDPDGTLPDTSTVENADASSSSSSSSSSEA
jgi:hypothetical protein